MTNDVIYLDCNSTTPIDPRVAEAVAECYAAGYGNPASPHQLGRQARRVLESAREGVASILGADLTGRNADRVIFTSGGTEANNLAIRGLAGSEPGRVIVSTIEHSSTIGAAASLQQTGFEICQLPVTTDGVVDPGRLTELLVSETRLVSVMYGNNETGVVQPVAELASVCRQAGVAMHTDAVQVAGKLPIHFRELGVDSLSVSAHKFHGPVGVGAVLLRHGVRLDPILFGGKQQSGLRPGTESVALAVGMYRALELWEQEAADRELRMRRMRNELETRLRMGMPELVINGTGAPRLPHTASVSFPGLDRQALLMALDLAGLCCSTGSACVSGSTEPSSVLVAMGCPAPVIAGALRLSLGATTTMEEIERAADIISNIANDLRCKKTRLNLSATSR
jgi:cysteine desulfurase